MTVEPTEPAGSSAVAGAEPQEVLSPLTSAAVFLVVTVDQGGEAAVRDLLSDVAGLTRSVGFRAQPEGRLSCVAAIGSDAWDRLFTGPRPAGLHPFRELVGNVHRAPATPGDLLFHIRAARQDLCFALAAEIMARLRGSVTVRDEVHGFKYFDERDLLGFVDGTENPTGAAARAAVLVADEDPDFTSGSYVIVQKYLHDMTAWEALPVEEQERVIGRRKLSDIELADDVKPADSHVALTTVTDPDGTERQILRDNMPFGAVGRAEFGTYFIGYARTPDVTETMLERMFLGTESAAHDRILAFSTAVTGCLFFAPTTDFLEDLPEAPHSPGAEAEVPRAVVVPPSETPSRPADTSLGIGSLKRSPLDEQPAP
ncbi:Dyp-type peroxidase [Streptomyces justiciae]|uniref:Dyp-type peroxidase n=1 Tax=Streptomyces justiciae TaxID=2780140 RepID=UPI00187ED110|nr:Dyp-type peroxidase [Streptomyces justiciae]MBE8478416.1 Dyp-type peroxidase [Streptomyces justiciae]MCW8384160.1 Dyp-type peroxidase [Streptomyces justiciae]